MSAQSNKRLNNHGKAFKLDCLRSLYTLMSIANELSSEIAAAMLSQKGKEGADSRVNLKEILVEVHTTLQHLTTINRRKRDRPAHLASTPQSFSAAASGTN